MNIVCFVLTMKTYIGEDQGKRQIRKKKIEYKIILVKNIDYVLFFHFIFIENFSPD